VQRPAKEGRFVVEIAAGLGRRDNLEGGRLASRGLTRDSREGGGRVEPGVAQEGLWGEVREHGHLLAQMPTARQACGELAGACADAAQAGLHPERRGDEREVERHGTGRFAEFKRARDAGPFQVASS